MTASPDVDEIATRTYRFSIIPETLLDASVSHLAYRLYGLLDRYAGENRLAFPARKTLAKRLRCSLSTVDRAIDELVAAGFLTVKPSYRSDGGKRPSLYILHAHGPDLTHGNVPDLMHGDVLPVTHGDSAESKHGDVLPVAHLNESHLEAEPEDREPEGTESHADCVGSVVPSPGLQLVSAQPEDPGEMLRDFSDEAVPPQPRTLRDLPKSKSKSKSKQELAIALAQADPVIVRELFETWAKTGKGKSHPSDERLSHIARALDWGFPVEDIRDALTGWVNDPWEDRHLHKDVRVLLRDPGQVEKFRDLKRNPPKKQRDPGSGLRGDHADIQSYLDFDMSTAFGRKPRAEAE